LQNQAYIPFLKSATSLSNPFNSSEQVLDWLKKRSEQVTVNVTKTCFSKLEQWGFSQITGSLSHETGKFFSIEGIKVKTNWGGVNNWMQPIINQPEIGFLGIIAKEFDGVLYFLMQSKIEPGNINHVQLSPTLQATKSNYTRVHKGTQPKYLEYFLNFKRYQVLLDQLQSEQGARFLRKRNRNFIIKIEHDIPVYEDFAWLTLGQITQLMQYPNTVNMDTRTVLSGITFAGFGNTSMINLRNVSTKNNFRSSMLKSCLVNEESLHTFEQLLSWFTQLKVQYDLEVVRVPLQEVRDWVITDENIAHVEGKFFKVIAVEVEINNREVNTWSQPLIEPAQEGICAFAIKKINGIYHFAVQAKLECGNFDVLELAPTVQCLTGNYRHSGMDNIPFLKTILKAKPEQIVFDTFQSEEGGRFYQEQNRNMLIKLDEHHDNSLPENFIWMTLYQLKIFIQFNNFLNIQARSLISMIDFADVREN